MKIGVIGTGYVGTVAGACFAEAGNEVICVDHDATKISALTRGVPVIYEPGLEDYLKRNLAAGRIRFTTSVADAVQSSDILFLTVGTPSGADGAADLSSLRVACRQVGQAMDRYKIIVNKSTVPVGTQKKVGEWIREQTTLPFDVVSNPEFLREGSAIADFIGPDRVVIGTHRDQVFEILSRLYRTFLGEETSIIRMDPVSAEMTKYACNAFLATRISFMNELARLCDSLGGDIEKVRLGMGTDTRIGPKFLQAGIGYGGSCFPKDIRALRASADQAGVPLKIVKASDEVNESQKRYLLKAIDERFGPDLSGKTFAIWGLAFKANTDDIREAPALELIEGLLSSGARVRVYDPAAMPNVQKIFGGRIEYCETPYASVVDVVALVIATDWNVFESPDYAKLSKLMKYKMIFDGRNMLAKDIDSRHLDLEEFEYYGIGRGSLLVDRIKEMPMEIYSTEERITA